MRATGVNPVTPLRLSASQASLLFPFFFSVPCAPLWLRGARAPFASPCPQQVPLSSPTLLLPWLWLDSASWVISHQKSKCSKKRGMILQLSCPSERSGAREGAEGRRQGMGEGRGAAPTFGTGRIGPATARLCPTITTWPGTVQCVQLFSVT